MTVTHPSTPNPLADDAVTTAPRTTAASRSRRSQSRSAALMVAPALFLLFLFTYLPAILSAGASLFDVPLSGSGWTLVGADNYADAIGDSDTRQAVRNTLVYSVLTIVPSLVIGFGLALLASGVARRHTALSTVLFLPLTANLVAMAVVFRFVFAFRGGLANELGGFVGLEPINFLGDSTYAMPTVAAVGVWRSASFTMVLFLGGLTSIPSSVHEAAAMDGVRGLAKVRNVILPMLRPTIILATVLAVLQAVQVFDTIEVMTGGGPLGATETILTFTWRVGFERFDLGRASALSFLLLVVLLAIGWARKRSVTQEGI